MKVNRCSILYNKEIKPGYFKMGFKCNDVNSAMPGQFISISIPKHEKDMPLRRPFTIYRMYDDKIEIIYKILGRGTQLYSKLNAGDTIDVLGPLGNNFKAVKNSKVILLGRGVGLASLSCLGNELKKASCHVVTLASFKNENVNFIDEYIESFSDEIIVVKDDDGSSDVENVKSIIDKINPDLIFTCGSKRLIRMLKTMKYDAYASLEERMGCGLGACLTCVVNTVDGYKRVCKDGPCFDVRKVII